LRSTYDIDDRRQLDLFLRRVGDLPMPAVPAYTSLDLRFGWRLAPRVELSLIGQNLWEPHHVEFGSAPGRSEYDRALLLRVVWRL
jgi:iron complex outermembrane receptor protein